MNYTRACEILGVNECVSKDQLKKIYYDLAKLYHPDKLHSDPLEIRKQKEEKFKDISSAYAYLHNVNANANGANADGENVNGVNFDPQELFETFAAFAEKLKRTFQTHKVKVPVTLEEVHNNKQKKLRLFLKGISNPIFIEIHCGDYYPEKKKFHLMSGVYDCDYVIIKCKLEIVDHSFYTLSTINIGSNYDLFCIIEILLKEYLTGVEKPITLLDSSEYIVSIPAFYDYETPIVLHDIGLLNKGNIYIQIKVNIKENWDKIDSVKQQLILDCLEF